MRTLGLGIALAIGCAGVFGGRQEAVGALRYEPTEPDRAAFLADEAVIAASAAVRERVAAELGPAELEVAAAPDPSDWVLHVTVSGADAERARAGCDAMLAELVRRRVEAHKTAMSVERAALEEQLASATDPALAVEARRKLEDLAAKRARTDARVERACALRAAAD